MSQIAAHSAHAAPRPAAPAGFRAWTIASAVLAGWFALVLWLGTAGAFVRSPGTPPLPIAIGALAPLVAFLALTLMSAKFREFVAGIDIGLLTTVQAWRFAGLGFLALYTHGVLPGSFALPAGLGDLAVGLTAPFVALAIARRPEVAGGSGFVAWNLFGMLDLVVAVGTGALASAFAQPGEVTTGPMATMPLVLIPAYLVPLLFMLHIASLIQSRRLSASGRLTR